MIEQSERVAVHWDQTRMQYVVRNALTGAILTGRGTFGTALDEAEKWQARICSVDGSIVDHPSRLDASGRCEACRP